MKNKLFWKKYRPKTIEEIILLPRIRKSVEMGITKNYIFHGKYGMGKSALSSILMQKHAILKINSSKDTGIETLRTRVDEFCSKMSMFDDNKEHKIVMLDEIDRISPQYQDALKGFIEEYEDNVRFIATTNHIDKITDGLKSRFYSIDFNPKNNDEIKFLKTEYAKRINVISDKEKIGLDKGNIIKIVERNFPDFRKINTVLQHIKETGEVNTEVITYSNKLKESLFDNILSKETNTETNYHFIMDNFGVDNIGTMIDMLGRPFIEYSTTKNRDLIPILGDIIVIVCKYDSMQQTVGDPIVLAIALIEEIKAIIKNVN